MTKRLVDIDDEDLDAARAALGVTTIKDAVALALREVVAAVARRQELEALASGSLSALADPEARARAWQ